jgi:hypothetical protein
MFEQRLIGDVFFIEMFFVELVHSGKYMEFEADNT